MSAATGQSLSYNLFPGMLEVFFAVISDHLAACLGAGILEIIYASRCVQHKLVKRELSSKERPVSSSSVSSSSVRLKCR